VVKMETDEMVSGREERTVLRERWMDAGDRKGE
jgi:hypothetical protein